MPRRAMKAKRILGMRQSPQPPLGVEMAMAEMRMAVRDRSISSFVDSLISTTSTNS